jgi:hypothetical protein
VVSCGDCCEIRLEDPATGDLFAACFVLPGQRDSVVETVLDSSRYFVLRIEDDSGKHAFVGLGFNERNDAAGLPQRLPDAASPSTRVAATPPPQAPASSPHLQWKMDGDGYDFFSQESAAGNTWATTANGHDSGARLHGGFEAFDLNSQATDDFPNIGEYGALLQGDTYQPLGRSRSSGLPPQPPLRAPRSLGVPNQRARGGSGWGVPAPQSALHLNFGASSSSAARRGEHGVESSIGASAGARQRVNIAATAPTRRPTARSNTSQRGGGGTRGRVSRPPAPRNGGITIGGSGQSFNEDNEQTDDVEELTASAAFR